MFTLNTVRGFFNFHFFRRQTDLDKLTDEEVLIASFAELPNGELLIVSYTDGIYQLARD